jgi:hypothetical protein
MTVMGSSTATIPLLVFAGLVVAVSMPQRVLDRSYTVWRSRGERLGDLTNGLANGSGNTLPPSDQTSTVYTRLDDDAS